MGEHWLRLPLHKGDCILLQQIFKHLPSQAIAEQRGNNVCSRYTQLNGIEQQQLLKQRLLCRPKCSWKRLSVFCQRGAKTSDRPGRWSRVIETQLSEFP